MCSPFITTSMWWWLLYANFFCSFEKKKKKHKSPNGTGREKKQHFFGVSVSWLAVASSIKSIRSYFCALFWTQPQVNYRNLVWPVWTVDARWSHSTRVVHTQRGTFIFTKYLNLPSTNESAAYAFLADELQLARRRKQYCRLLSELFRNKYFIVTTSNEYVQLTALNCQIEWFG